MAEMDLKDKEKNAVSLQNKGDEEYIKEGTWKDGAFYTVMSQFVRNPTALLGFAVMLVIVVACVAAPLLCNFSPYEVNPIEQYQTPNAVHWFGTDSMGRDMFARILYGGRNSLALGIGVPSLAQFWESFWVPLPATSAERWITLLCAVAMLCRTYLMCCWQSVSHRLWAAALCRRWLLCLLPAYPDWCAYSEPA